MIKKYLLYLIRWQLSTPVLAVCFIFLSQYGTVISSVIANFIGGLLFFWIDKWIFEHKKENR